MTAQTHAIVAMVVACIGLTASVTSVGMALCRMGADPTLVVGIGALVVGIAWGSIIIPVVEWRRDR
ncbi:hypothetical protein [Mycolicibacterium mucogenicum]|uniref:hypothetical protein n=1 Tax=Mycolicibacterium mucogenicum TaxID=56689 RepID=UPI00076AD87F|nr:hypothetical protein [Mycolicibacterium mucogenicum]